MKSYAPGRRRVAQLLIAAPAAAALPTSLFAQSPKPDLPKTSPLAEFIAGQQKDLSDEERALVVKGVVGLEDSLKAIREFPVANDVAPALAFVPLRPPVKK